MSSNFDLNESALKKKKNHPFYSKNRILVIVCRKKVYCNTGTLYVMYKNLTI